MENEERNMYVFIWKIENYSYCWHKVDEHITSPSFQIRSNVDNSWWNLRLYPRGKDSSTDFTSLYMEREFTVDEGLEYLIVDYEFSLLKSDGTPECTAAEKECKFAKGESHGLNRLLCREEIIETKKSIFLPEDTLTVQCRICVINIALAKPIKAFAKSTVLFHRQLFLLDAGEFNDVSPRGQAFLASLSKQPWEVSLQLIEDSIYAYFKIDDANRMFRFRMGILDSSRSASKFLIDEYKFHSEVDGNSQSRETFLASKSNLLQRKNLYLPEGRLTLHCEFSYSTGMRRGQVDCHVYDKIFTFHTLNKNENSKASLPSITQSRCCDNNYDSMKNDFQHLYEEETLSDFTIKVGSENLHVHKAVLCARSSVFTEMLTSSKKEIEKNVVAISDFEIGTVRRMLTFMYTDKVDDLDWEMAKSLYFLADKYYITMLKRVCIDFLKICLNPTRAEEIFQLARIYKDEDLMNVALKFEGKQVTSKQMICKQVTLEHRPTPFKNLS